MCTMKWDMIKTIGDQDDVEDVSSDSDVEVEVISNQLINLSHLVLRFVIMYVFSTNQKNTRPKVMCISTTNSSS